MVTCFEAAVFEIHYRNLSGKTDIPPDVNHSLFLFFKEAAQKILSPDDMALFIEGAVIGNDHAPKVPPFTISSVRSPNTTLDKNDVFKWRMTILDPREFWEGEWYCILPQIWQEMAKLIKAFPFEAAFVVHPWLPISAPVVQVQPNGKLRVSETIPIIITDCDLSDYLELMTKHPISALRLNLLTPLIIEQRSQRLSKPTAEELLYAALNRQRGVLRRWGRDARPSWVPENILEQAAHMRIDLCSGSYTSNGLVGQIALYGDGLDTILALLLFTELTSMGKATTKGNGRFRVSAILL